MKDKRTYKTRKEHSNDMSYENEASITNKDRGESSLSLLLEQHQKEIWEWKQKEHQWIRDRNQLDGNKRIIVELSTKMVEIGKANLDLKKRVQEAQGEPSVVKAVGSNSPEMKALQARINRLDDSLASALEINESHQRYNGKLQKRLTEVEEDNKKLAKQIQDLNNRKS